MRLILAFFLFFVSPAFAQDTNLTIVKADGVKHEFVIELANSPESRARGLMFRQKLDDNKGMLFNFGPQETEAAMWMKNTYIPLDMLFIKKDGTIHRIGAMTTPHSLETVSSQGNVLAVLELAGGVSAKLGIKAGDKIVHLWFGR